MEGWRELGSIHNLLKDIPNFLSESTPLRTHRGAIQVQVNIRSTYQVSKRHSFAIGYFVTDRGTMKFPILE